MTSLSISNGYGPRTLSTLMNRWAPRMNGGGKGRLLLRNWRTITLFALSWFFVSAMAIVTVVGTYWAFYNWYIPTERLVQPLYFDYTLSKPVASASLSLRKGLQYDLSLRLLVPDMEGLAESLGPVVFSSTLEAEGVRSVRPMLPIYHSRLARMALLMVRLVPVVLGIAREATPHRVFLLERFTPAQAGSSSLKVEMASRLPTYEVTLEAVAHFEGLRYVMYYWKWTCAGLVIGGLCLGLLFFITIALGLALYARISEDPFYSHSTGSALSTSSDPKSIVSCSSGPSEIERSLKMENFGTNRPGWGLSSLRRRFHTTEELRVPNGGSNSDKMSFDEEDE